MSTLDLIKSDHWIEIYKYIEKMCNVSYANRPSFDNELNERNTKLCVIQLTLVDELNGIQIFNSLSDDYQNLMNRINNNNNNSSLPFGLGARSGAYLIVTRFHLTFGIGCNFNMDLRSESRVIHNFTISVGYEI